MSDSGFWERDLDEFIGDPLPEGEDVPPPNSREQLDWLLRKGMRLQADLRDVKVVYDAERERLDGWLADRTKAAEAQLRRIEAIVEAYARPEMKQAKVKTLSLPHGTVRMKALPGRVVVADEDAFKAWALTSGHDELVRVNVDVNRQALGKLPRVADKMAAEATEGGEKGKAVPVLLPPAEEGAEPVPVPGVTFFKPAEDRFSYELEKETRK